MSCKKAWALLKQNNAEIEEEVNASTMTIQGENIFECVKDAEKVIVASGKKIMEFDPRIETAEMLTKISGRTGNLRAPTLRCGTQFYVGFNEELYRRIVA